jgi:hypothetical protein
VVMLKVTRIRRPVGGIPLAPLQAAMVGRIARPMSAILRNWGARMSRCERRDPITPISS